MTRRTLLCAGGLALAGHGLALRPARALGGDDALARLLGRRRMVRRFKSDPVSDATIHRLLATARRAPSAGHTQPWVFLVVRNAERRALLGRAAVGQMFLATAPVAIIPCADMSRSKARYGSRGERYGLIDTAFASMCLLLAIAEEGLGACFVGAFDDAEVARLLRLPPHVQPLAIIPVGHPVDAPPPLKLRPLRDVVREEQW